MVVQPVDTPARPLRMTEEEFERWGLAFEGRAEFVDGEVIILCTESAISEELRFFLGTLLNLVVREQGLGLVYGPNFAARLRVGLRRVPDLMAIMGEEVVRRQETYLIGAPSVAVEIVSKDSEDRDRVEKFREYQAAGVQEYWIIDPLRKEALFHRLQPNGRYRKVRLVRGRFHSAVIPGFWLDVSWFWQQPLPQVLPILRQLGIL